MSTLRVDNITDEAGVNPTNFPVGINAANLIGQVVFVGMTTPPEGYLKANGAAVSRTTYDALFAAIGTTFGTGDGSTTFNLPDLRGEFPRGWDDGRGIDSGRSFGTAQLDAAQGHRHKLGRVTASAGPDGSMQNTTIYLSATSGSNFGISQSGRAATYQMVAHEIVSNGTNGSPRIDSENRSRNVALLACIKF